ALAGIWNQHSLSRRGTARDTDDGRAREEAAGGLRRRALPRGSGAPVRAEHETAEKLSAVIPGRRHKRVQARLRRAMAAGPESGCIGTSCVSGCAVRVAPCARLAHSAQLVALPSML